MKCFKKIIAVLAGFALLASAAGCAALSDGKALAESIMGAVSLPDEYSIAYEITSASGEVRTVEKTRDSDGNVYFRSGSKEILFIQEEGSYAVYQKGADGSFTADSSTPACSAAYVAAQTAEFLTYAEQSKKQFLPGVESTGEQQALGRDCLVYGVNVGIESAAVTYSFLVDKETGVCLGWQESQTVAGFDLGASGEVFTCTKFLTENIPSLQELL